MKHSSFLLVSFLGPAEAFLVVVGSRSTSSKVSMATAPMDLDPKVTALVLIEYQNEFTTPGGKFHQGVKSCMDATNMLENSSQLARYAREAGCTIVHCPISFEPVSLKSAVIK